MLDLVNYFREQAVKPISYGGQRKAAFQQALQAYHSKVTLEDCDFYHTIETKDGIFEGAWDLRGHENAYLGHHDFSARKVIEFGPASGWLSAHIAKQAGELLVFDLPLGSGPEIVPYPNADLERVGGVRSMTRLRNSWWFARRALGFNASAVYADIYNPPPDLGRFDVAVFGAILLHLSNPFRALQCASLMTDEAIIVTDVFSAPTVEWAPTVVAFNPTPPPIGHIHWWSLSPTAVKHMLAILGFTDAVVSIHSPTQMASQPPMFTVVARRPADGRGAAGAMGQ